jgi:beta-N-acetylhexosaminidase
VDSQVDAILSTMTLEQKVGQLFVVYFTGDQFSPELEQTIRGMNVGGILIFQPNFAGTAELAQLINAAQTAATSSGAHIPLLVAVDHEGGIVNRFEDKLTQFPGNMAIGATGSTDNAKAVAHAMAGEMRALGFNMNLAPVVDTNSNPDNPVIGIRSFGSDPQAVARYGSAMIQAFQASGVIATAKHFPGHGDTSVDSHFGLPLVSKSLDQLWATELIPFQAAIHSGVDAVMTAHIAVPALTGDSVLPATLSQSVLVDLLRKQMGFDGLIATDSLGMGALDQAYGVTQASVMAFEAGADLLMYGNDLGHSPSEQYPVYQELLTQIHNGTISTDRVDESVRRILRAKLKYGILNWQPASLEKLPDELRTPENLALSQKIAEQSVTLVRNDQKLLPLSAGKRLLLVYPSAEAQLVQAFSRPDFQLQSLPISLNPSAAEIAQVTALASQVDVTIIATVNGEFNPGQVALVQAIQNFPTAVIALQSPYDLLSFPSQQTYVATYSDSPASVQAVAKLFFGEIAPTGKLPVSLPNLYPIGSGLTY